VGRGFVVSANTVRKSELGDAETGGRKCPILLEKVAALALQEICSGEIARPFGRLAMALKKAE
ncbi:MAG TPA: hypothetical protein VEV64_05440, partial [Rhizomicrobium sp.]|nr:hypothetical protein [Rhizomicrobium sp.]